MNSEFLSQDGGASRDRTDDLIVANARECQPSKATVVWLEVLDGPMDEA